MDGYSAALWLAASPPHRPLPRGGPRGPGPLRGAFATIEPQPGGHMGPAGWRAIDSAQLAGVPRAAGREGEYLMRWPTRVSVVLIFVAGFLIRCSTAPSTPGGRDELLQQASATMSEMSREDPGLDELVRKGYGYALFPEISKGGLVFGGAYGRGVVYEQGQHIGYADLRQASFGLQVGGQ